MDCNSLYLICDLIQIWYIGQRTIVYKVQYNIVRCGYCALDQRSVIVLLYGDYIRNKQYWEVSAKTLNSILHYINHAIHVCDNKTFSKQRQIQFLSTNEMKLQNIFILCSNPSRPSQNQPKSGIWPAGCAIPSLL